MPPLYLRQGLVLVQVLGSITVNSILAPVAVVSDQLETLASQRMVRMGDLKNTFGTVRILCS
jgi:glycerol kinase